ncbi:MAG: dihydrodipicolinate synthase family protein [Spirochaetes bacterium]|nr:dihydrodipicolinate synthase family protein [Spirochaetota bacterium]
MIKGSLVPNITIFTSNGEIDVEKTAWHMDWMLSKGVDGLFLTGSYGAGPLMSVEERIEIFKIAKKVASKYTGKVLIPHVGCIDTKSTIHLAQAAERLGVDAVASVPPFYYKHEENVVIQFYKDLIDSVKIPVFAYNNPETSRYTFTIKAVNTLMEYGMAGLKDSPLNISFLSRLAYEVEEKKRDFQIIPGTSMGWLPLYYMGVRAVIAGMNNWAPEIITELVRSTFTGDFDRARKVYIVMAELSSKMHFTDSTLVSHLALQARGYDAGFPRKPMLIPPSSDSKIEEVKEMLMGAFNTLGIPLE